MWKAVKKYFWGIFLLAVILGISLKPSLGAPIKVLSVKRTWNADIEVTNKGQKGVFHGKWINYLEDSWQPISYEFVQTNDGFVLNNSPLKLKLPLTADGTAEIINANKFNVKEKKIITEPDLIMRIKAEGVIPVNGKIETGILSNQLVQYVVYPNAYPQYNADLIYYLFAGEAPSLRKLIRFRSGFVSNNFLNFSFLIDVNQNIAVNKKNTHWSEDGFLTDEKGMEMIKSENRKFVIKDFHLWDSGDKKWIIDVKTESLRKNQSYRLTKIIPAVFFTDAVFPVYTDTETTFTSTSGDGTTGRETSPSYESFSALRGGAQTFSVNTNASDQLRIRGNYDRIYRNFFPFDTSAIGSNQTVTSSTLQLYISAVSALGGDLSVNVTSNNGTFNYAIANWGNDDFSTDKALSSITIGTFNNFNFNSAGKAAVNTTGTTYLGFRWSADIDNVDPSIAQNAESSATVFYSESANDPRLIVEYSTSTTAENRDQDFFLILSRWFNINKVFASL